MALFRLNTRLAVCAFLLTLTLAAQTVYQERYRPQVHFSPREHWTNDPNGLVYFDGEYHLFFQFNPFGDQWGHMSWGHAVSNDLLHWRQLPVAIAEMGNEMVFTGSVVVDRVNTTGFCAKTKPCLVAVYTGHRNLSGEVRQTQNLAYSLDQGRTWTRYADNPVLDLAMADFRDPSVSWDEGEGHWRMVVSLPKEHKVRFYASPDLKHWRQLSDFGPAGDIDGDWECPDLLHLPGERQTADLWMLKIGLNPGAPQGGSGEQYFLGSFDGKRFQPSSEPGSHGWTNYGKDDYCAISFNNLPRGDKPVLIGWMNNWQYASKLPTSPWRGQMSIPRLLSIMKDNEGVRVSQQPITAPLRTAHRAIRHGEATQISGTREAPFEVDLHFAHPSEPSFGVRVYSDEEHWTEIGFDREKREFYLDRRHSGNAISQQFPSRTTAPLGRNRDYDIRLIVDRSSIEAFAQNGTIAMTHLIFPLSEKNRLKLFSSSGKPLVVTGDLWELRSIWK